MKILIIRFSSIGDIVLTSPVARCLHRQLSAEVHYLTKKAFRSILDASPYVAKVYAIEKRVGEVRAALEAERYDAVLDLHHNLRSIQVRLGLAGVPAYAFDKINIPKWLMVRFKIDRLPRTHIVHRYIAAAAPLGTRYDGEGLDYFIPPQEEVGLEALSALFPQGSKEAADVKAGRYYAFAIGAAHATKRMPEDNIISICRQLDAPVVLLGGPSDAEVGRQIAAACAPHVANACGAYSLHQSASIVRQALRVITHDTGLMHIAAAFRKEIISLWGNTIPEFGMAPFYPEGDHYQAQMQTAGLRCRPCSKIGFDHCPRGHFRCMRDIDASRVAEAVMR